MNQDHIKESLKKFKKNKPFFITKVASLYFLIAIITTIIIEVNQINFDIAPIILSGFFVFFAGFVSLFIGMIGWSKKQKEKLELIVKTLWKPLIDELTYPLSDTYDIYIRNPETQLLTHDFVPRRASEEYYYTLKNIDSSVELSHIWVYSRSSNGQNTSTTTYFKGHFIQTNIEQTTPLFVRSDRWFNKVSSKFNGLGNYETYEDVIVNGTYTEALKKIRKDILSMGFKDVIMVSQQGKLCIGVDVFQQFPRLKKVSEEEIDAHKIHLKKMVDILEYLNQ